MATERQIRDRPLDGEAAETQRGGQDIGSRRRAAWHPGVSVTRFRRTLRSRRPLPQLR